MNTQTVTRCEESIALDGATRARIRIRHGAGQLVLRAGTNPDVLLTGALGAHAEKRLCRDRETLEVELRITTDEWRAWFDPTGWLAPRRPFDWDVRLSPRMPLAIEIETGASRCDLDLSQLRVTELVIRTGASATQLTLPSGAGMTEAEVHAGLAAVTIRVPTGVAVSVRGHVGLAVLEVDQARFPRVGDRYESPDFGTAANRVILRIESGLGSVSVI